MNNLNSILLEGVVEAEPKLSFTPKGTALCAFIIKSERSLKFEDEVIREIGCFEIRTRGRLAEVCAEYLKKGRGVRVVGDLKEEQVGRNPIHLVFIFAEHVEFKPVPMPSKKPSTLDEVNERRTGEA